jgi:hypothetical protein
MKTFNYITSTVAQVAGQGQAGIYFDSDTRM